MIDFTLSTYKSLIKALKKRNYQFLTVEEYFFHPLAPSHFRTVALPFSRTVALSYMHPIVIMRHDVDRKPENSLKTAIIENKFNIKASYYFRVGKESNQPKIIKQIADLGHEIGYHYEDLTIAKGDYQKAIKLFEKNLDYFRKFYPVETICMHGSPKSAFDNRDIWKKYDYRQLGIIGEPYFDIDFDKIFYLTDTGRCWNGYKYSVRDKMPQQERWVKEGLVFKTTNDIIKAAQDNKLPNQIMITIHPQRWTNNYFEWAKELLSQRLKNMVKWGLIQLKHK